jgi:hypothetical protein
LFLYLLVNFDINIINFFLCVVVVLIFMTFILLVLQKKFTIEQRRVKKIKIV